MMNVADFKDPHDPEGRNYRQVQAAKVHSFPLGALVEVNDTGARLFVGQHTRDCDQTPLYSLAPEPAPIEFYSESFAWDMWRMKFVHGWCEDSLTLINPDPVIKD
ncbi:hypothetical protein CcrC1_gp377 [Caulobacter phage C1]|nr:hypothetical protein CcrC1_gp377 [Caulobacter phage C1]UTU08606.1 hypothetical protein CcrC2_gp378 [Caulobacter phage C2]UTU09121.1 hypothetical protein CcrJ4_gp372 [Caulobacter phage J4]WGN97273.1 hypothetical protein [Bertelyvirus sp.]WGN97791.1 hypothetical protein [Bertelyvirus sp.]